MRRSQVMLTIASLVALTTVAALVLNSRPTSQPAVSSRAPTVPIAPKLEPPSAPPKQSPPRAPPPPLRALKSKQKPSGDVYGSEIGIPILMFHRFGRPSRSKFSMTPAEFRLVLEALQNGGYCVVSLEGYLNNRFDADCAGKKPVALTFDDSHPSQIGLLSNGQLDPESALGVLREVWPGATGTFFANVSNGGSPFGRDTTKKVALLESLGNEIGNHTVSHARVDHLSKAGLVRELRGVCAYFGHSHMNFAYPYGVIPVTQIPTALPGCAIPAAFGANTGYFEGLRWRGRDGVYPPMLAPLPGSSAFQQRHWRIPRLNISSLEDLRRDVLNNPNVYTLPATP